MLSHPRGPRSGAGCPPPSSLVTPGHSSGAVSPGAGREGRCWPCWCCSDRSCDNPHLLLPLPSWKMDAVHPSRTEPPAPRQPEAQERPNRRMVDRLSPELRTEKYILLSMDGKLLGPELSRIRSGRDAGRESFPLGKVGGSPPVQALGSGGGSSHPAWIWKVPVTPKFRHRRPGGMAWHCRRVFFGVPWDSPLPKSQEEPRQESGGPAGG